MEIEKPIILKECRDELGVLKGHLVVYMTPELLDRIKADKLDDKMGWQQHKKVLKEHGIDID